MIQQVAVKYLKNTWDCAVYAFYKRRSQALFAPCWRKALPFYKNSGLALVHTSPCYWKSCQEEASIQSVISLCTERNFCMWQFANNWWMLMPWQVQPRTVFLYWKCLTSEQPKCTIHDCFVSDYLVLLKTAKWHTQERGWLSFHDV